MLKFAGLYTASNPSSTVPEGAAGVAKNVVSDYPGTVEPRPGFELLASTALDGTAQSGVSYRNNYYVQTSNNKLQRWDGATLTNIPAHASAGLTPPTGFAARFCEIGGRLYMTTSYGVERIGNEYTTTRFPAGIPRAGPGVATLVTGSWLATGYKAAYRTVLVAVDQVSGDRRFSAPSEPFEISNTSGSAKDVQLAYSTTSLPDFVHTIYGYNDVYVQVYRTTQVPVDEETGDEMFLAAETYRSSAASITDSTPDGFLGQALYTNANEEGPGEENFPPPVCRDIASFRDHTLCVNVTSNAVVDLSLLTTPASGDVLVVGSALVFQAAGSGGTTSGNGITINYFTRSSTGDPAVDIEANARSLVQVVAEAGTAGMWAHYTSGEEDNPGQFRLERRDYTAAVEEISCSAPEMFAQRPAKQLLVVSAARAGSTVTLTTSSAHGLTASQNVALTVPTPNALFPIGTKTVVSTPTSTTFTYTEAGSASGTITMYGLLRPTISGGGSLYTTKDDEPGGIAVSKVGKPEAFPLKNRLYAGDKYNTIYKASATQDGVLLWTAKGLYALVGDALESFRVVELDHTTVLTAAESTALIGNSVYALTNQGVVKASISGGVQIISRPIEDMVLDATRQYSAASLLAGGAWGVGHVTARKYILHFVGQTARDNTMVYNVLTNTWTTWVLPTGISAAAVNTTTNKLYFGYSSIYSEMSRGAATSFADGTVSVTVSSVASDQLSVVVVSASGLTVGDTLMQGALRARITNIAGTTLTLDKATAIIAGAATVYRGFEVRVEWTVNEGGDPGSLKAWQEAEVFLGRVFPTEDSTLRQFYVTTRTENGTADDVSVPVSLLFGAEMPQSYRVDIPRNAARSNQLRIGVKYTGGGDGMRLHGLGLVFRSGSEKFRLR